MSTQDRSKVGWPAKVGIVMGSDSDLRIMEEAVAVLDDFGIPNEVRVTSAHRTPDLMLEYASTAATRGIEVIIAGAGGAAHLPGMLAAATPLPVIGVPVSLRNLDGLDSLLSIVQMPRGVPVATVAIDAGANAGLLAVRMLSIGDEALTQALLDQQKELSEMARSKDQLVRKKFPGPAEPERNQC